MKSRIVATLSVAAIAAALAAAPAAHASAAPAAPKLPADLTKAVGKSGLDVQTINGWEAVTGPAASVNELRVKAADDKVGTITNYTGMHETGLAILIFTGDDDPHMGFGVEGATIASTDNDTDQTWYLYKDDGTLDTTVKGGTAENIPAAKIMDCNFNLKSGSGQDVLGNQSFKL